MSLTSCGGGDGDGRKAAVSEGAALELLDEYWFYSNTLVKNGRQGGGRPGKEQARPGKEGAGAAQLPEGTPRMYASSGERRLLRTPSLPSPRVGMEPSKDEEVVEETEAAGGGGHEADAEDDDLNWSSIYEGVLRSRIAEERGGRSALQRAPSMPVTSSATGRDDETAAAAFTKSTLSMSRLRHAHSTLERHCRSHTPTKADRTPRSSYSGDGERRQPRRELRSFSANQQPIVRHQSSDSLFQDKKLKSSSDLESIEVQGFRDLGFVFDQEELRESLADVIPGLRGKAKTAPISGSANENEVATTDGDVVTVQRPYLSEAWHHVRRPADARSAAEMKDQIRMWAQAVASNVRQEC
ncbi:hypothetical protein GUJ93_ZPchr0008g13086 [Zizania palustris]|uniref:Uncharacterized protein n=1 Tax=Zizania palustris TaxID=103762 RepID=A0A8J5RU59_ZIZPA|nr:hypothetical protein GUJ93_ZPchr0008g13086 [Zizania palustris]